ncbi:MAG TPA: SigB/SigF/SigG family RNA polymerase sigma factor [Solirubrobacterales bacterium]|nr:SigB/SigF/SigG family RNA polymerase sigma factor [Solirubrobacterales bacterium]
MESKVQHRVDSTSNIIGLADEADLWERRDSDPHAREELVNRYLAFAKSVAVRYRSQAESLDDLVQVASLGLVNAINRFDPARGVPFIAFASPTITGELKRHFRDRTSAMRLPRSLYDRIGQIDIVVSDLTSRLNREPSIAEIAAEMSCPESEVTEAFEAGHNRHPVSLDQSPGSGDEDQSSPAEWLGREDSHYETAERRIMLRDAMDDLSGEERMVIRLRFRDEMTQSEIAEKIGHSQMHVSRMLRRILDRMGDRLPAAA